MEYDEVQMDAEKLDREIRRRLSDEGVLLVGIDGFGGAGKSTLAARLIQRLHEGLVVPMDDFIVKERMDDESWERGWDRQRLIVQVLEPIRRGETARPQRSVWETNSLSDPEPLPTARLVIVEGLTSLHPDLRDFYDISVWVDTPIEVSKRRGAARDFGNENAGRWDAWARNDLTYQATHHPESAAGFRIDNP